jgi:2-polyprenyl-6-hydroxyphenyl methylase/3-demethylubiquinone-9 3-methyltransferase
MTKSSTATIDPKEARHFGALASDWWNPKGSSAMLHKLNPVRLGFIRAAIDGHWGGDGKGLRPLAGKTALDVGCGAGLVCEPLARLGADVTGVDAAPENIAAAKAHAATSGLAICYGASELECIEGTFNLVTALEVIEHVTDPATFIAELAEHLAPGGLMILSTPNRTPQSRIGLIALAEGLGFIPRHTHDWDKFLTPDDLTARLDDAGLRVTETRGITFSPTRGLHLSDDLALNYIMSVVAA